MAERVVKTTFTAQVSGYLAGTEQMKRSTKEMTQDAKTRLAEQESAMRELGGTAMKMGAVAAVGLGLIAKSAIDWESAWTGVLKTVDGTPEQLAAIEDGLRGLAKELPATHGEIAAVAEAAGQLGVAADDVVEFTRTMVDLGETTNLTADEAATAIAQMMNVMQTAPEDVDRLGSALVALGNDGASTERDIILMAQRIAGAGKTIGLSEGEVLGFANALSSVGIEVEAGGSAISRIMIDIAKSVSAGGKNLEAFASVAGMSSKEFSAAFKSDPTNAIATFVEGLGKVNAAGGDVFATLSDLGQTDIRVTNALLGMSNSGDLLRKSLELGNEAWEDNIALQTEAEKRYATTEAQLQKTQGAINDAAISFGEVLLPALSDTAEAVSGFAGFLGDMPEPLAAAVVGAAGLTVGVGLLGGGFLTLVPRIAATKVAMIELNLTGARLGKTLGKGGGVLIGITAIAAGLSGMHAVGVLSADALADLDAAITTGNIKKLGDQFGLAGGQVDGFGKTAEHMFSGNFWENGRWLQGVNSAVDTLTFGITDLSGSWEENAAKFEHLGKSLATVAQSDFRVANKQFQEYVKLAGGGKEATKELLQAMPDYRAELISQAAAQGKTLTEQELLNLAMGKGEIATLLAQKAAAKNAGSLEVLAGQAADTESAVEGLSDELRNFGKTTVSVIDAEQGFHEALRAVTERMGEEGFAGGLDLASEAGSKNMDVLQEIASATNEFAAATYDSTGSVDELNAKLSDGRASLIETAMKFGATKEEAEKYADQLIATPDVVKTRVELDTHAAQADLQNWLKLASGNVVRIAMGPGGSGGMTRADGGPITGTGGPRQDNIPIWASVGEHMLDAEDVKRMGGHAGVYAFRQSLYRGYADGGAIGYVQPTYVQSPRYAGGGGSVVNRSGDTFQIYEASDGAAVAQAVSRRQNSLGAV